MLKRTSPRCRSFLQQRISAYEVKLHMLSSNIADILRKFHSLLKHQKAVANGYAALPESKKTELASAIAAGKFRSEKLCCILMSELEKSSTKFADEFHIYLRTHKQLHGSYPTDEQTKDYT